MRAILILSLLITAVTTAACSRNKAVVFNGVSYRGQAEAPRNDRKTFTATIRPVSAADLTGARAAGRHQGIRHCIRYYGTSDILWTVGPETPPEQLRLNGDSLTFRGTCAE